MPLSETGNKILKSFKEQYGKEKGEDYFYASMNKGTISKDKMERKRGGNLSRTPKSDKIKKFLGR